MDSRTVRCIVLAAWVAAGVPVGLPAELPAFDFTTPAGTNGWAPTHDIGGFERVADGLRVTISGGDPYLTGPARDYPAGVPLWLRLRLRSDQAGSCQIFYFTTSPTEPRSVRFSVPAGQWVEGRVPLPALGAGYRMRIDPPGTGGTCTLASLRFEARGTFPDFDFATVPDSTEWQSPHDLGPLVRTLEGLRLPITGNDPYLFGPARDYPAGKALWLRLRLKSDTGGMAQVFYFTGGATEENSVRFYVPGGDWYEAKVRMPALGAGYRLRIDPPGTSGNCLLGRLWFEERVLIPPPAWPVPEVPELGADALSLESGDLRLVYGRKRLGDFEVQVAGQRMAVGHAQALVGYRAGAEPRWFNLATAASATFTVVHQPLARVADAVVGGNLRATATAIDPDGARWQVEQTFALGQADSLAVTTRVLVDQPREVLHLPLFTLLPGLGSYGTNKSQAILAGVEYLENEPSSSTADLNPPGSNRQVPDTLKLTFPLMALAADGRYLGLMWSRDQVTNVCAMFDSPDRFFGSTGHVMGLLFPGSDGQNREESSLVPYEGVSLPANRALSVAAMLVGGRGTTVIPAVQQYVRFYGIPPVPDPGMSPTEYYRLAAHGWLDSQIRDGDLYRHAAPGFGSTPAADAAFYMDWLAGHVDDAALAGRLEAAARTALAKVALANYNAAQVGHVDYPVPALRYGGVLENAARSQQHGQALLGRFQSDGSVHYQKPATGLDYGKTHWAPDANGLTAQVVLSLLEDAVFAGDRTLIDRGLRYLRALDKFRDTVPRGAQTWEIPLHTPDILAAGYLVRAYTLGYELTGETAFLEQAKYWAWTGLPFVYLSPPTPQPVGAYSTIPVLGATAWVAPNWIGLPVQWCGLVYADALHRLARHDPGAPWKQVADGIAISGVQQSYPATDTSYVGLLPDSYNLRPQSRNGPNINPATVLAPALKAFGQPWLYDFLALNRHGLWVHAPGPLGGIEERAEGVQFKVQPQTGQPCWILVNGFRQTPKVRINGHDTPLSAPHRFQAAEGRLALRVAGESVIELGYPALAAVRIERLPPGRVAKVSWPRAATGFALEAAEDLGGGAPWAHVDLPPFTAGDWQYVTEPADAAQRFYRLTR